MNPHIHILEQDIPAFLACLGIGTLQAIRSGILPADISIWTMAPPRVWEPLAMKTLVPEGIIDAFRRSDELSAIKQINPHEYELEIERLIEQLQSELGKVPNPAWQIRWIFVAD